MKRPFKVVVTDFVADSLQPEQTILRDLAEVVAVNARSEEELAGQIEDADAVLVYHTISISSRTIQRLSRCRLILRCGAGYDNVDHAFARQCGIAVANVPDYGTEEVADSAIALMLALTRGIGVFNSLLRGGDASWTYTLAGPLQRLRGRTFAVVGLGRIGSAAALRAKAFTMDVAYYDPYKPAGYDKALGVRRVNSLNELLEQAHVLTLHCPLTSETHRLINGAAITRMPTASYLINTARGPIVDTSMIPEAIESGRLAGAGFDVLEHEPPKKDDPLISAWRDPNHPAHTRVLISPHGAFYSEQSLIELRTKSAEACRRALQNQPLHNIVN